MIARVWKGWTSPLNAEAYERLLRERVLPQLHELPGYQSGYILRHDGPEESEFLIINFFSSLEAVKAFAGDEISIPVFEPEARALLSRIEERVQHYEVRHQPT